MTNTHKHATAAKDRLVWCDAVRLLAFFLLLCCHAADPFYAAAAYASSGGYAITHWGYSHIMALPEKTPEQIELFWTYCTPNVVMMTIGWFLIGCRIRISENGTVACWLAQLTLCGFGIYMVHYYFVCVGYDLGALLCLPAPLRIPFSAIVILLCSWAVTTIGRRCMGRFARYIWG